ncbi:MAG: nuclear transport factor 2 family protein [Winogradskyella sp.]|uniref:nuclear transport factor 2 family protein n=1 Tax=Winogradskyella sp. TaxID=1883156 RepID=UPI0018495FA9|nr:nuclear transport factor 2 family protein [Winogradskyella sp.]
MKELIKRFYNAFDQLDANTMVACYHKDVVFEDPAFGVLEGDRARAMWQMLCENQKDKDFKVNVYNIKVSDTEGTAQWEAFYIFSKTGKKIHNKINATFEFKDGLIIKHTDKFSLHKWATQAFGVTGFIMGKTHFFKSKLNHQTNHLVDKYIQKKELL